jgi:hypothetical protein
MKQEIVQKILYAVDCENFKAESIPYQKYINEGKNPQRAVQLKTYAALIRACVNELQYYQCCEDSGVEDMVVDARALYELADSLYVY